MATTKKCTTKKCTAKKSYRLITQKQASTIWKPLQQTIQACTTLIDEGQLDPEKVKELRNIRRDLQKVNERSWHIEVNY